SREISKKFEQTLRGTLQEVVECFKTTAPRGEIVIVLDGKRRTKTSKTTD
ncbi:MAG: 16S rRNA (cytidine(1402)-2'-O)-methyltransferase, partial [Mucinivorans sp.]